MDRSGAVIAELAQKVVSEAWVDLLALSSDADLEDGEVEQTDAEGEIEVVGDDDLTASEADEMEDGCLARGAHHSARLGRRQTKMM